MQVSDGIADLDGRRYGTSGRVDVEQYAFNGVVFGCCIDLFNDLFRIHNGAEELDLLQVGLFQRCFCRWHKNKQQDKHKEQSFKVITDPFECVTEFFKHTFLLRYKRCQPLGYAEWSRVRSLRCVLAVPAVLPVQNQHSFQLSVNRTQD